jgi:hypothetical protein
VTVGELTFSRDQVTGLGEEQLRRLARIGAVGLAVRDDALAELGAPILERRRNEARVERLREELTLEWAGVDDEVLEARYRTRPEWELEVRHLVVLSERWRPETEREEARSAAERALARIEAGEAFEEVAGQVSEEPGAAERGGLLTPGRRGTWVPEFWEAASALEEGEVSPVVETEYGFHVLRLETRREVPFSEARDRVAGEVAAQIPSRTRWEEWVEERTASIAVDLSPLPPTGLPDPDADGTVVHWRNGELAAAEVARRIAGFPRDTVRAFERGDGAAREAVIRSMAGNRILLEEADGRGILLPEPIEATLFREWERSVRGWARAFRFEEGVPASEVAERALAGLTGTGQNLEIARREVDRYGPAIEGAYPVRTVTRD